MVPALQNQPRPESNAPLPSSVTALIPCYNAGSRVAKVIEGVLPRIARIIVVDDGCSDGCMAPLVEMPIQIIKFPANRGKGFALIEGFRTALGRPEMECVACIDADGQHDPAELPGLYAAFVRENADLLVGARTFDRKEIPFRSWFGNTLTRTLFGMVLGAHLADTQSGYRLLSRRFVESAVKAVPGGRYETELALLAHAIRGGFRLSSAPIKTLYEPGNASSHFHKLRDSWRIYRTLLGAALRRG